MAEAITSWTATAASNTTVDGINIAENCPAANMNDAVRAVMASIKYGVRRGGEIAYSTLGNVAPTVESKSGNFTIQTTDNMKRYLVTAAATVTEGASAPVAGDTFTIINTGAKGGGYLVTLSLTIDGVSGYILGGGESVTLHALGSSAYRIIAEKSEPTRVLALHNQNQADSTGDGTAVTLGYGNEIADVGGVYNNSTYTMTAIKGGLYAINAGFNLTGLTSSHVRGGLRIVTNNRTYTVADVNPYAMQETTNQQLTLTGSCNADVDAGDTVYATATVSGGAKVVDINPGSVNCVLGINYVGSLT